MLSVQGILFAAFIFIVIGGGGISVFLGYSVTTDAVVEEAQRRAELDLRSAWAIYQHEADRIRTVVRFASLIQKSHDVLAGHPIDMDLVRQRLEGIRNQNRLDVLTLIAPDGRVVLRTRFPYNASDIAYPDAAIRKALDAHTSASGTVIVPAEILAREGQHLAEAAHIELADTPMAVPSSRTVSTEGMMIKAVEPVFDDSGRVIGYVYGGVLLNRNNAIPDSIRETVFRSEEYEGRPLGTATLFQGDLRIATNVRNEAGNRAVGTRVSGVVHDTVLENGRSFYDRAWVVNDWYLTAYDPIRDPDGRVVGILYVGVLEKKYLDQRGRLVNSFVGLAVVGTLIALVLSLVIAGWIFRPIRRLTRAARAMSEGDADARVRLQGNRFREFDTLARAFNDMAESVARRSAESRDANRALYATNQELTRINSNYMETLGFVTHELKSPLASCLFGIVSLRDGFFGPLNPEQIKTLHSLERNLDYLTEMIHRYLTLSRIEKGELVFQPREVMLRTEVLEPSLEQVSRLAAAHGMTVDFDIAENLRIQGDPDLLRIVFDNLLSNAVKYGREGGTISIRREMIAGGRCRLRVRNEGRGIPPDQIGALFQKFSRLDLPETSARRGTGLGLFISREIVERHGGTIRAESREGEDTTFIVELPLWAPPDVAVTRRNG